jgi:hypothetical protein
MTDELEDPTNQKQPQRPAPLEKEQWQRNHNHRNADAVSQFVQAMLMLGFVVFNEALRHLGLTLSLITYHLSLVTCHLSLVTYHVYEDIHRPAADHSFLACLFGREREMMQFRPTGT